MIHPVDSVSCASSYVVEPVFFFNLSRVDVFFRVFFVDVFIQNWVSSTEFALELLSRAVQVACCFAFSWIVFLVSWMLDFQSISELCAKNLGSVPRKI